MNADSINLDQLDFLFKQHQPRVRGFFADKLCRTAGFAQPVGHLHLLRSGTLKVKHETVTGETQTEVIREPSVLFYPRPIRHGISATDQDQAELLCASIDFGPLVSNPIINALPNVVLLPVAKVPTLQPALELLFAEAFSAPAANQVAIDNLMGYFLILLLRQLLQQNELNIGLLAALQDPRLARALQSMHESPQVDWNLERVADAAGMSRARFAVAFRDAVGQTPMDYLTDWRINLTQVYLLKGDRLKRVADKVGYQNAAALGRAFKRKVGVSPAEWLSQAVFQPELPDIAGYRSSLTD
ncbi:MAG: AraC family transcriptional regulator [Pseudomonadales bacterium]